MEQIIAVSATDKPLQAVAKLAAHKGVGVLHRAITIILINERGEWLLTQRSPQKPLWPGWWDFACSTHQSWPDEDDTVTAQRRLYFELGANLSTVTNWRSLGSYEYHAVYSPEWSENEVNHIWVGNYQGPLSLNPDEVAAHRWEAPSIWQAELSLPQHHLAPWIAPMLPLLQPILITK